VTTPTERGEQRRIDSTLFLDALWRMTDGSDDEIRDAGDVAREAGIDPAHADQLARALRNRGLKGSSAAA